MRALLKLIAIGSVFLAAGCSSSDNNSTGPNHTLNGTWQGTDEGVVVRATLQENNHQVTGSGTATVPNLGSAPLTVTGTANDPDFSLNITVQGIADAITFVGAISTDGNQLSGTVTQGDQNSAFTMTRQ